MTDRIKYLVEKLNQAAKAHYQEDREILSKSENPPCNMAQNVVN